MRAKIFIATFLLIFSGCDLFRSEDELCMQVEDASCTEVWLRVKGSEHSEMTLYRDDKEIKIFNFRKDTTIIDEGLKPSTTYEYQVSGDHYEESSNRVTATTLDTTSHDFTWEKFTFGEHSSSTLNDVAIIDENDIWAVGEIYLNDSTGVADPNANNAVHWDGNKWTIKRITVNFRGNKITPSLHGIFAFSGNQIWIAGGLAIYGDGDTWTPYDVRLITGFDTLSLNKCWGSIPSQMYFVGLHGSLVHYDGQDWQKIESGTDLNIYDIWGSWNNRADQWEILAVAGNYSASFDRKIIRIDGTRVSFLDDYPIAWSLTGLWFIPNRHYYLVGSGIYEKKSLSDSLWENGPLDITHYGISKIRGIGLNDLAAAGGWGEVLHYNGISWKSYFEETGLNYGNYISVAIKDDLILAVGEDNPKAVILMGRRRSL